MDYVIKFTEHSTDPDNYNKIHANLRVPCTQFSSLVIESLSTTAAIEVLNQDDYIIINNTKIQLTESYSSINSETIATLIAKLLRTHWLPIAVSVDNTNRIVFSSEITITISDCTYNLAQALGIFDSTYPLNSVEVTGGYKLRCPSVGNFLSTPILYLIASIGEKCYVKGQKNKKILMRINNSYIANFPVIANNADFSTYALSNDFSDIDFELVDANFKSIKLLSPMYITGSITADPKAETINTSITITPDMIGNHDAFD